MHIPARPPFLIAALMGVLARDGGSIMHRV